MQLWQTLKVLSMTKILFAEGQIHLCLERNRMANGAWALEYTPCSSNWQWGKSLKHWDMWRDVKSLSPIRTGHVSLYLSRRHSPTSLVKFAEVEPFWWRRKRVSWRNGGSALPVCQLQFWYLELLQHDCLPTDLASWLKLVWSHGIAELSAIQLTSIAEIYHTTPVQVNRTGPHTEWHTWVPAIFISLPWTKVWIGRTTDLQPTLSKAYERLLHSSQQSAPWRRHQATVRRRNEINEFLPDDVCGTFT